MKILIVDDSEVQLKILGKMLRDLGYANIHNASSGEAAWNLLKTDEFDLVLSDWQMKGMSGLDLLKSVRTLDKHKDVPFIMITAVQEKARVLEALKMGASSYVFKPCTRETLVEKLTQLADKFPSIDLPAKGFPAHNHSA
jgi:two-component system chemotaxis response regulator CheY